MRNNFVRIIIVLIFLVGVVIFLNHSRHGNRSMVTIAGEVMGTTYHIKVVGAVAADLPKALKERLDEVDALMSTYKKNSDVSRINRSAVNSPIKVANETFYVLTAAQQISVATDGAFDVTIGKLVNLWGFGPTINIKQVPDDATVQALRGSTGYRHLHLDNVHNEVTKDSAEVYVDLSAIAKGYAVDAAAQLLLQRGIDNFMVEIGGEIITHGHKYGNLPWVIGIESPQTDKRVVQRKLYLHNVAMATSGDYRNYFEFNGQRYSHTIDPATGYPIRHRLASVTVISDSCMHADALATALMVMGPQKGIRYAREHNLAILMLIKQGNRFIERRSSGFERYLRQP